MSDVMNDAGCSPCHRKTTDCTWVYDTNFCPYLAFSYTKHELFASENTCCHKLDVSQNESDLHYFLAYKNTITVRCSLRDDFSGNVVVFNVYKWRCNKSYSCYSELNSLQNVYFGFSIFSKLTKWCCFVTYLSNDPRISMYLHDLLMHVTVTV